MLAPVTWGRIHPALVALLKEDRQPLSTEPSGRSRCNARRSGSRAVDATPGAGAVRACAHQEKIVITIAIGGVFGAKTPPHGEMFPEPVPPVVSPADEPGKKKGAKDEEDEGAGAASMRANDARSFLMMTFVILPNLMPSMTIPSFLHAPAVASPDPRTLPVVVPVCGPAGCLPAMIPPR